MKFPSLKKHERAEKIYPRKIITKDEWTEMNHERFGTEKNLIIPSLAVQTLEITWMQNK